MMPKIIKTLKAAAKYAFKDLTMETSLYRLQQLLILMAHLVLLKWMIFSLSESGRLETTEVFLHFGGMALYGAILIRGTAYWAKLRHQKETQSLPDTTASKHHEQQN